MDNSDTQATPYTRVGVHVSPEDWRWVRRTALDRGTTASALVRAAITQLRLSNTANATHVAVSTMTDARALGGYRPGEPASPNQQVVPAARPNEPVFLTDDPAFREFRPAPKTTGRKR